ncbi:MAG: hypothetical protein K1563_19345 [Candidatus Thiodiazotropha sp. (ex. Lucinisca nassula)]|nr:hypothetical protein [Candidatus Thiodiazotropha sp. (ex. Lucinisca nassula)]MBW9275838.1 hypothetical protein [Candidatus Thiodiazotropha sp. (ex. Lucinisca nassula)]
MTSDIEYAGKIIRNYEQRKKRAAFYALVSVIFGVSAYLSHVALVERVHGLTNSISSDMIVGRALTESDIKLVEMKNQLSYNMGLRIGLLLNTFATASGISIGYCFYLLFWSRKERIFKELHDKTRI